MKTSELNHETGNKKKGQRQDIDKNKKNKNRTQAAAHAA